MTKMTKTKKEKKNLSSTGTLTAAQRLEMLEKTLQTHRQMINIIAEEMDKIQQTQLALAQKVEATIKVSEQQDLEKKVTQFMVDQQIKDLKSKTDLLISQGALTPSEEVTQNSFVVGKELTKEGEVVSPRTQASVASLPEEVREKLKGKKVGDLVSFGEDKLSFMLEEVYEIASAVEKQLEQAGA
jgi:hypothetical protein